MTDRREIIRNRRYRLLLNAGASGGTVGADIDAFDGLVTGEVAPGGSISGAYITSDGLKWYGCTDTGDQPYTMLMDPAHDPSSADTKVDGGTDIGRPWDIWVNEDEDTFWVVNGNDVEEYTMSTPGDISTMSTIAATYDVVVTGGLDAAPRGLHFAPDGTSIFVSSLGQDIGQILLSSAWDLSSVTSTVIYDASDELGTGLGNGITLDPSGTKIYLAELTLSDIWQYNLSTAWDLTTAAYSGSMIELASGITTPFGIFMDPAGDGTEMFGSKTGGTDTIWEMNLT